MKKTISIAVVITVAFVIAIFAGSGDETKYSEKGIQNTQMSASLSIPQMICFQGVLTDARNVPLNGKHDFHFYICSTQDCTGPSDPIWDEEHDDVLVYNGLINVWLGNSQSAPEPIPPEVFRSDVLWLKVVVNGKVLPDPLRITSFPYAYRMHGVYSDQEGNVGIGTSNPISKLCVAATDGVINPLRVFDSEGNTCFHVWNNEGAAIGAGGTEPPAEGLYVKGRVGLGRDPNSQLTVQSGEAQLNPLRVYDYDGNTCFHAWYNEGVAVGTGDHQPPSEGLYVKGRVGLGRDPNSQLTVQSGEAQLNPLRVYDYDGNTCLHVWYNEGVAVGAGDHQPPSEGLYVKGVIELGGGSDIAEPFDVLEPETTEPGMVVVIDPKNPGKLKAADKAYDRCVVGIVSGAGGINPGLTLTQEDTFEGSHQVALTGRVYGLCDASYGSIEPGDLLTSSPTQGYAMKVNDFIKAQGAILGKAMTQLEEGQGFVLVLVSLQ
jgi:hypothetical protein